MAFHVRDEILKRTTKCTKRLTCLSGQVHRLCKVSQSFDAKGVPYIACCQDGFCLYNVASEDIHICSCPVRRELLDCYGV